MISCEEEYPNILNDIAKTLLDDEIELVFVDSTEMQKINKNERSIDKTTDVLSFPYEKMSNFPIGSIVINKELAKEKADELNHDFTSEIALLFIHGLLHILGYDHENDTGEMREKELELITKFNLPKSLIIRSQS
ncbi:rRNA maturation RNase [Campylobacter blaseri]|uniref:Endoribonuclease YbeY n=1 Tax=Campylobacter blaseri TaxID=2042961 RepID=A0A2P8R001_9BACT|nr:rRNA maturation RNase YbeY [Campylobacter blaseri]PSM51823.1 rRNA maturation RNase YbeY [Campylobacter blaseri]PSM53614.1 rRNA maturation RNase YbeY [Campylobacter blaseri]QKF86427.1 rRNA maturation RNase [Campylobacter blaseri]